MLARTKKRLTEGTVRWQSLDGKRCFLYVIKAGRRYAIPKKVVERYEVDSLDTIPASDIFAELHQQFTEAGALLKGVRAREALTQSQFSEKIGVTQANLSKMETGKRPIGRQIAKRIEKVFGVNYQYFLA